jgi:putative endonuclease
VPVEVVGMVTAARARSTVGRWGEDLVATYLVGRGMVIVERNWRCPLGEVDIVALHERTLVLVEVKTRTTQRFGSAVEAVTPSKLARLRKLAARWLHDHPVHPDHVRIDVVGVLIPHRGAPQIDHREGVA